MEISLKLGMFFFMYYLITGIAMLINPKHILRSIQDIFANNGLMLLVGFIALIFGLFIVSFHNYYEMHWPLLITIFGWLAVIKGLVYLIADNAIRSFATKLQTECAMRTYGLVMIIISVFFAYNIYI